MSDIVAVQLIVSVSTLLAIVLTAVMNRKATNKQNVVIEQTHAAVNSSHTKLEARMDRATLVIEELKKEVLRLNREGVITPKRGASGVVVEDGSVSTASERQEERKP